MKKIDVWRRKLAKEKRKQQKIMWDKLSTEPVNFDKVIEDIKDLSKRIDKLNKNYIKAKGTLEFFSRIPYEKK